VADEAAGLSLRPAERGVLFEVKAQPGGRCDEVAGVHDGALRVRVTAAPEKGKANKAILKTLARALQVRASSLRIVAGESAGRKTVLAEGLDAGRVRRRLGLDRT
jgi:hypothetical protein